MKLATKQRKVATKPEFRLQKRELATKWKLPATKTVESPYLQGAYKTQIFTAFFGIQLKAVYL
jgi:hypothetical protein